MLQQRRVPGPPTHYTGRRSSSSERSVCRQKSCRHSVSFTTRVPQKWCPDDTTLIRGMCYRYRSCFAACAARREKQNRHYHETDQTTPHTMGHGIAESLHINPRLRTCLLVAAVVTLITLRAFGQAGGGSGFSRQTAFGFFGHRRVVENRLLRDS